MLKRFLPLLWLAAAVCVRVPGAAAQVRMPPDSVIHAFVPAIAFSSNEGFIMGGLYSRYDYKGGVRPFTNYLQAEALASFKGYVKFEVEYIHTRTFGQKIRSEFDLFLRRYNTDNFFGIGNNTGFSQERWQNEYYYFKSVSLGLNYQARKPVHFREGSRLDLLLGAGSEYHIPYVRRRPSSFARFMPNGSDGGWVNYLKAGLIRENRDNEFDPRSGNRLELEVRFSPELISTYALTTIRFEYYQYFFLFNQVTVANRLALRHAGGDVPFWEMSTLGDDMTLRGYPLNRFQGHSSIAYTLELRTWLFGFPDFYNLKFGGQLFTDTGRVFTPSSEFADLFRGYKQTFGFGGAVSFFSPDFILRGDMGFSEEMTRIYIGLGYWF